MIRAAAVLATLLLLAVGAAAGAGEPTSAKNRQLFVVPTQGDPAIALARADARLVARYESFSLVEAAGEDAERLARSGALQRDDMEEVQVGERQLDPATDRPGRRRALRLRRDPYREH